MAPKVNKMGLKSKDRIVFLGDSITQQGADPKGYVSLIKQAMETRHAAWGIEIINAGIGGHKVPDIQARLEKDVLSRKPTVVVVYIGINDVWHSLSNDGTPKDRYVSGLTDVLSRIQKTGVRVLLCTPSVIGEKKNGANPLDAMLEEYSGLSRQVAAKLAVPVCDLRQMFKDHLESHNPSNQELGILTADTCHLNEAGNAFVARQILLALGESA